MGNWHPFRRRLPLSGSLGRQADATARACSYAKGVHFRGSALCRYMRAVSLILLFRPLPGLLSICERATAQLRGCVHFRGFLLCSCMEAETSSPLRLSLRGRLRPSFRPSFRCPAWPNARQRPSQAVELWGRQLPLAARTRTGFRPQLATSIELCSNYRAVPNEDRTGRLNALRRSPRPFPPSAG